MRRLLFGCFTVILLATFVFLASTRPMAGQQEGSQRRNDYVLRVEGTEGVRLKMLLITKRTERSGPTRESVTISVPFSRKFSAASFYAWFDTLPGGESGQPGDVYRILMEKNGRLNGEVEDIVVKPDVDHESALGDL